jgi:hypothetical protein
MTIGTAELSEALQSLVDTRLDTIDRMLVGRVPRQDRLAIVREVESQVFELLQERQADELTREDVLAVLARLDPPEAYLPDEGEAAPPARRGISAGSAVRSARHGNNRSALASGIVGLLSIVLLLVSPVSLLFAEASGSTSIAILILVMALAMIVIVAFLGIALAVHAGMRSAWSVVGLTSSVLSLIGAGAGVIALLLFG